MSDPRPPSPAAISAMRRVMPFVRGLDWSAMTPAAQEDARRYVCEILDKEYAPLVDALRLANGLLSCAASEDFFRGRDMDRLYDAAIAAARAALGSEGGKK